MTNEEAAARKIQELYELMKISHTHDILDMLVADLANDYNLIERRGMERAADMIPDHKPTLKEEIRRAARNLHNEN